jgi:hypothetical protein
MTKTRARAFLCLGLLGGLAIGVVLCTSKSARASMFGEENLTLTSMLVQLTKSEQALETANQIAGDAADLEHDLVQSYQEVNAGIQTLKGYSTEQFLQDLQKDFYQQYPGFAKLEYASANMSHWNDTRASSPWTAYQAITAVAGDLTGPLRDDVRAGKVNVDDTLLLKAEAAGGFALASQAEAETKTYDSDIQELNHLYEASPSPGTAQMVGVRANLLIAAQNSHIIRLLSRAVRLDAVNETVDYAHRLHSLEAGYATRDAMRDTAASFTTDSMLPPALMDFSDQGLDNAGAPAATGNVGDAGDGGGDQPLGTPDPTNGFEITLGGSP